MKPHEWSQRLGVQTIIWGEEFVDGIEAVLQTIHKLGFKGVEFAQVPAKLGDPGRLEDLLAAYGLTLLGLAGGSLATRLAYCERLHTKPKYLYVQRWEPDVAPAALAAGYTLALHPHQYTPIDDCARARRELERAGSERFLLLPDTAHLFLATGKHLAEALGEAEEYRDRFEVVHLKDWSPEFGWSMFAYSRGFTELGQGIVPLAESWTWLKRWLAAAEDRWVVVEQDSSERSPSRSLSISLDWLQGVRHPRRTVRRSVPVEGIGPLPIRRALQGAPPAQVEAALTLISAANLESVRSPENLFATILAGLARLTDARYAVLSEVSAEQDTLVHRAFWQPASEPIRPMPARVLQVAHALSGGAIADRTIRWFPRLTEVQGDRRFQEEELMRALDLDSMVSIPVHNQWNMNQPELLINLFPRRGAALVTDPAAFPRLTATLGVVQRHLGVAIERAWEGIRAEVTNLVNWEANRAANSAAYIPAVMHQVRKYLHCEEAAVYLLDPARTALEPQPQLGGAVARIPLSETEHPLVRVWRGHYVFNSGTLAGPPVPAAETSLIMPIYQQRVPLAEPLGVIWCRRKSAPPSSPQGFDTNFCVTDEVILDAVQSALVPHLERMIAAETRAVAMRRIKHELQGPLTVMRGATRYAIVELQTRGITLAEDYLGECRSYISLMEQIVAKAGFLRPEVGLVLQPTRVLLFKDVIVPAVEAMEVYLEDRGFSRTAFDFANIKQMPALYIDKARFQQVVFNLLSNAVKYSDRDPNEFRVRVFAEQQPQHVRLMVQDWGTGIPDGMAESIFLEGVRGPNAFAHNVSGDGIGLWMVREIIRAHGGTIKVTRLRQPTEFTLFLPNELQSPRFQRPA